MTDPKTAAEALEAVRQSRAAVAERMSVSSLAYDLAYSGLVGGMIAAWALPRPWQILVIISCAGLTGLLARRWARARGVFVSGLTPPRARWVAIGLGVILVGLMLFAVRLSGEPGGNPKILGLAAIAAAVAFVASRLWLKVFRRETGADA